MRKLGILFLAMTLLLFAACTSDAKQPTVPATPIPTVTSTPVPTATLTPTDTPVPTATPTPTSTPTPTPEIIPTYDEVMAKWNAQKVPMTMKMPLTITFSENIEGASFSVSISADVLARVNDNVSYTKTTMDYMGISFDTEAYIVRLEDGTTLNYSQYDDGEWFYVTSEVSTEFASDYESFFSSKIAGEVERTETGYKVTVSANELMDSLLELLGESMGHSDFVITYYADKDLNLLNGTGKLECSMDMDEGSMSISLSTDICVDENPLELPKEVKAAKEYSEWHGMNTNPLFGTLNGVPFQAGMSADYFGKDDWEPYEFYYGSPFVNEKYGSEKDYDLLYLFCARGAHYRTEIGNFDDLDKYGVFGYCYEPVSDPDAVHPDFVWGNNVRIGASTADLEKEYGHPYEEYCDEDENGIYGEYTYYIVEEDYTYRMIFYFTNDKLIGVRFNSYCMHVDDGSCSICSNLEKEAADMEKAYGHYIRMCEACDEYIGYGLEFPESITSSFSIVQFSHGLQLRNEDLLVEYADSYVKKGDKAGILDYFYGFGVRKPQHGTINDREVLFGISDPDPDTGETKIYVLTETNETCEHYLETYIIVYADGYDPIQLIETFMAFI